MTTTTSGIYGDGSYGLKSKTPGGTMRVWFCGATRRPGVNAPVPPGGNISPTPCAHRTRDAATNCPLQGKEER
jgi:hypothetical protein